MNRKIKDYLIGEQSEEILKTLKTVDLIDLERRIDEVIDEKNARVRRTIEKLEKDEKGSEK